MTSTLLTASRGVGAAAPAAGFAAGSRRAIAVSRCPSLMDAVDSAVLLLLGAIAGGVAELLSLVHRRRLELRPDHLADHWNPVGHERPLLAVPLLEHDGAGALVVFAGDLDRVGEA